MRAATLGCSTYVLAVMASLRGFLERLLFGTTALLPFAPLDFLNGLERMLCYPPTRVIRLHVAHWLAFLAT
eukprot:1927509-Lingulodinium_polyedra.AAC.1